MGEIRLIGCVDWVGLINLMNALKKWRAGRARAVGFGHLRAAAFAARTPDWGLIG